MHRQSGRFETQNASKYLVQLCKHFAHKVDVTYDTHHAEVDFPFGKGILTADDTALTAHMTTDNVEVMARARAVIDDHLKRFAFRECFEQMTWAGSDENPSDG